MDFNLIPRDPSYSVPVAREDIIHILNGHILRNYFVKMEGIEIALTCMNLHLRIQTIKMYSGKVKSIRSRTPRP